MNAMQALARLPRQADLGVDYYARKLVEAADYNAEDKKLVLLGIANTIRTNPNKPGNSNLMDIANEISEKLGNDDPADQGVVNQLYSKLQGRIPQPAQGGRRRGKKSARKARTRKGRASRKHRRMTRRKMRGGCWGGSGCS